MSLSNNYAGSVTFNNESPAEWTNQWGSQILIPTIAQAAPSNVRDISTQNGINQPNELAGVSAFLNYVNSHGLTIKNIEDVWKYSTFITYIADSRDIAALQFQPTAKVQYSSSSLATNLLQAGNYTLTTFSGECTAFSRLYDATWQNISSSYQTYIAFILPYSGSNVAGHAIPLMTDGTHWYVIDYYNYYVTDDPISTLAYEWHRTFSQPYSNYVIVLAQNEWYASGTTPTTKTYTYGTYTYDINTAMAAGIINTTNPYITYTNYMFNLNWIAIQNKANSLFEIQKYQSAYITLWNDIGIIGTVVGGAMFVSSLVK